MEALHFVAEMAKFVFSFKNHILDIFESDSFCLHANLS